MRYINLIRKSTLTTLIAIILTACSSGGSGTQNGLNITGNWRAAGSSFGYPVTVTLSLAQTTAGTGGIREVPIDGTMTVVTSIPVDGIVYPFTCILNFEGGTLNTETNTFTIGSGEDDGTLVGTAVNNNSITATASGADGDDGFGACDFSTSVLSLKRF